MKDKSYGVEVSIPDAFPATVTGLATKEDAERWIERHKNEIAQGAPQRSTFNSRMKPRYFEYCRNQTSGGLLHPSCLNRQPTLPRVMSLWWWWCWIKKFGPQRQRPWSRAY
jgi:hypothetical protein